MKEQARIMLTVQDAANYSGMAAGAIRRACCDGSLAHVRIGKAKLLIHRDVFDEYLRGKTEAETEPAQGIRRIR